MAFTRLGETGMQRAAASTTEHQRTRRNLIRTVGAIPCALIGGSHLGAASPLPVDLPNRPQPVPLTYFGLHIHDPDTRWPSFKFGRLRLWDTRTSWMHLQPARERWDFTRLDKFVSLALQAGVQPVLPLGLTPTWASARPTERSPYNVPGAAAEPADLDDWRHYVRTVALRYKTRIAHYEIWNEVNAGAGFFSGTAERMLELQQAAYAELKSVDPAITVISPSVEGSTEDKFVWFERYMALMRGRYADVVAYHFYDPRRPPESLPGLVRRVRSITERYGAGHLPIWNTESGYRVDWSDSAAITGTWATWPNLAPEQAAAWLVRAYLLGWMAGLDGFFWYSYDNKVMGMTPASRADGPITRAYGALVRRLAGRTLSDLRIEDGIASVLVRGPAGPCRWVWNTQAGERDWQPPADWQASVLAPLLGNAVPLRRGNISIAAMPILLAGTPLAAAV